MRFSVLVCSLVGVASAAPTFPDFNLKSILNPDNTLEALSDYFNTLATRVQLAKVLAEPPTCDVSKANIPTAPEPLPSPSEGLTVSHVVVGRGTQNYTCGEDPSEAPKAAGALAQLFDVGCIAALYPDLLERLPSMAVQFNSTELGASDLTATGIHYFTDATTPYFDLGGEEVHCKKTDDTAAPSTAAVGQKGEKAVAWLKLDAVPDGSSRIREVYRVDTAGGSPPATCEGMGETFEVQYATTYWFFDGDEVDEDSE